MPSCAYTSRPPRTTKQQRKEGFPYMDYPDNLPKRYNGQNCPCDMFVGPCSCGAWHYGEWTPPHQNGEPNA